MKHNIDYSGMITLLICLIGVLFIILKSVGVIQWSWWWVTFPFWGSFSLIIINILLVLVVILWKVKRNNRNGSEYYNR
jgi:cbb3-type cytochrome oxidase subunit 3